MTKISNVNDTTIVLNATDLTVSYPEKVAVNSLSLSIPSGKITVLIGPNGCGKSTLLKTLARVLQPTCGAVTLDAKDIFSLATQDVAKRLSFLPQGPVTPDELTVKELVSQGRFPYQSLFRQWRESDETAVVEAMKAAKVDMFADLYVDQLSGGQRQRCWIAMVLAQETKLILLDEPTTFLDLKTQVELMDLVSTLAHEKGYTLVIVLHELNLAAAYADYLVMMRNGAVIHSGAPSDIFNKQTIKDVFDLDADIVIEPSLGNSICVPKYKLSSNRL